VKDFAPLIPEEFATVVTARPGGPAWLAALPDLVGDLLGRWELRVDGPSRHGNVGVVIPVRSGGLPLALKVSRPSAEVDNQIAALKAWDERGMVRLVAAEPLRGALLLERLDVDHSLDDTELPAAVDIAATLLRRLTVPAAPAVELPHLSDHVSGRPERWIAEWEELGRPLPRRLLDATIEACLALAPDAGDHLVNHDLHYRNILAGTREPWLAIDPRGVLGDPEFALGPLLWNRFGGRDDMVARFRRCVDVAGLDSGKARGWTMVRAVAYFLWATRVGLTWDPAACREIVDWLADSR